MKVHENYIGRKVVAISDPELLGKTIEDTDKGLEINVSKFFYGESEFEFSDIMQFVLHSENINVIGNKIVDALITEKLVDSKNVITIGGIKHAQIYKIGY